MTIKLTRESRPEPRRAFWVGPYGEKMLRDGTSFDFDAFYSKVIVPTFADAGLTIVRADQIYGRGDVTDSAWDGIQRGQIIVVDFTAESPNVAAEFALSLIIGKRIIVLTQDPEAIPSDVRGHYRYIEYHNDYQSIERLRDELSKEIPAALEQPANEMILVPMHGGSTTHVPAKVIIADRDFVMVRTDDGRRVVLSNADVDYRRIVENMARRYPVGTELQGALEVDLQGDMKYTLVAEKTNPWPAIEAEFPPGRVLDSIVDSVIAGVGAFVHVIHGVNGLVPEARLAGRAVAAGDRVRVAIAAVDLMRRRITLRLDEVSSSAPATRTDGFATGDRFYGSVARVTAEGQGGYVLVRPQGHRQTLMLHCSAMSAELRKELNDGDIAIDDELYVEVIDIDATRGRVAVKDLPLPEDEPGLGAAA